MLLGARQFFERRGAPTPPLPYDAEVEYLESTGTQYIDTGIFARDNLLVNSRFKADSYGSATNFVFRGSSQGSTGSENIAVVYIRNNNAVRAGMNSSLLASGVSFSLSEWHDVELDTTGGNKSFKYDGSILIALNTSSDAVGTSGIILFANTTTSRTTGTKIQTFSVKDTTTGQMMIDLDSVRKNGVGYMYDRVSGNLFGNAGTGAFTIGPDKS